MPIYNLIRLTVTITFPVVSTVFCPVCLISNLRSIQLVRAPQPIQETTASKNLFSVAEKTRCLKVAKIDCQLDRFSICSEV